MKNCRGALELLRTYYFISISINKLCFPTALSHGLYWLQWLRRHKFQLNFSHQRDIYMQILWYGTTHELLMPPLLCSGHKGIHSEPLQPIAFFFLNSLEFNCLCEFCLSLTFRWNPSVGSKNINEICRHMHTQGMEYMEYIDTCISVGE